MMSGMRWRRIFPAALAAIALAGFVTVGNVRAETTLTINGYGGAVWETIDKYIHAPYTAETGVKIVNTTQPNLAQLKAMVDSGNMIYEAIELNGAEYVTAAKNGWIEEIDYGLADPQNRHPPEAKKKFGMVFATFSTIIGYRTDKFPEGKGPQSWADFWDVAKFPGKRSMQNAFAPNLEIALMADGVPKDKVYEVLATDEGVDRAFRKLDEIKPHVTKWWNTGAESVQLLADGEVSMGQAWNGRIFDLAKTRPVQAVWNQGVMDVGILSVPKGNPLAKEAMKYFTAWGHPERIAKFAEIMSYSNLLPGVNDYLKPEQAAQLSSSHTDVQLTANAEVWDSRRDALTERWNAWLLE
ncbi:MAG: ABC transporter substrate-binding protein [Parvibaculaceae bacterium]